MIRPCNTGALGCLLALPKRDWIGGIAHDKHGIGCFNSGMRLAWQEQQRSLGSLRVLWHLAVILASLRTMRAGDFSLRLPGSWTGLAGKIADTFNEIVSVNQSGDTPSAARLEPLFFELFSTVFMLRLAASRSLLLTIAS